jgi:hypothetical protein
LLLSKLGRDQPVSKEAGPDIHVHTPSPACGAKLSRPHSAADVTVSDIGCSCRGGGRGSDVTGGCYSKAEPRAGVLMIQYDGERNLVTVRSQAYCIHNH